MEDKLHIPTDTKAVLAEIAADAELHTATGWRLAARLAAIVRLNADEGRPVIGKNPYYSTYDLAKLGLRGLTDHKTVARHVNIWLTHSAGVYPEPGDTVDIPGKDVKYPPNEHNLGSRMPQTVDRAVERVIENFGVEAMMVAIPVELVEAAHAAIYRRIAGDRDTAPRPVGPREKITDKGVMRSGQYLLGAQEARDDGLYTPGPEAAIMLGLFERADWDDALAGLTGRGAA